MCQTSLSTGLSEWELGPHHAEQSPIKDIVSHYITSHINAISTNVPEFLPHVPFHFCLYRIAEKPTPVNLASNVFLEKFLNIINRHNS